MSGEPLYQPEQSLLERTREPLILVACTILGLLAACVCWFIALAVRQRRQAAALPSRSREDLADLRQQQSDQEWNRRAAELRDDELGRLAT